MKENAEQITQHTEADEADFKKFCGKHVIDIPSEKSDDPQLEKLERREGIRKLAAITFGLPQGTSWSMLSKFGGYEGYLQKVEQLCNYRRSLDEDEKHVDDWAKKEGIELTKVSGLTIFRGRNLKSTPTYDGPNVTEVLLSVTKKKEWTHQPFGGKRDGAEGAVAAMLREFGEEAGWSSATQLLQSFMDKSAFYVGYYVQKLANNKALLIQSFAMKGEKFDTSGFKSGSDSRDYEWTGRSQLEGEAGKKISLTEQAERYVSSVFGFERPDTQFTNLDKSYYGDPVKKPAAYESIVDLPGNFAPDIIKRLIVNSSFKREEVANPNSTVERRGETFRLDTILNPEHEDIAKIQALKAKTFRPDEVDPPEFLVNAIQGRDPFGNQKGVIYQVHTIKDTKGELLAVLMGERLDILDKNGAPTGKQCLFIEYLITDPSHRMKGYGKELYMSAVMKAHQDALKEGKQLVGALGEGVSTSETFWNRVGWKRIYTSKDEFKQGGPEVLKEPRYYQAPLHSNPETGDVAEGTAAAPEHIMWASFADYPNNVPSKEEVAGSVGAFFNYALKRPRQAFTNAAAHERHVGIVDKYYRDFESELYSEGRLVLLDSSQRFRVRLNGGQILEHSAADHNGEAGEDDL